MSLSTALTVLHLSNLQSVVPAKREGWSPFSNKSLARRKFNGVVWPLQHLRVSTATNEMEFGFGGIISHLTFRVPYLHASSSAK